MVAARFRNYPTRISRYYQGCTLHKIDYANSTSRAFYWVVGSEINCEDNPGRGANPGYNPGEEKK
jgi:hypothetical protein